MTNYNKENVKRVAEMVAWHTTDYVYSVHCRVNKLTYVLSYSEYSLYSAIDLVNLLLFHYG